MQIVVLGMHRSGTSAVTRILNLAGAYFGPEGISNGADEGNPKGFWERLDVRRACDGLLQDAGFDWWQLADFSLDQIPPDVRDRRLAELRPTILDLDAHRPWVVKEPRLSLLLPLVRPLLEVPVCVHVSREPLEVAESLRARNGFPVSVGLALWELYTIHAFQASAGLPRLLVRYEDLMADPIATVDSLVGRLGELGVQGLRRPSDQEINAFLSADLHRQHRSKEERADWLTQRQAHLARPLDEQRIPHDAELGSVSAAARDALRSFQSERRDLEQERRALAAAEETVGRLRSELEETVRDAAAVGEARAELHRELDLQVRRADLAAASLARAQRQVQLLAGSRSWRAVDGAARVRRRLTRAEAGCGPVDKALVEIGHARDHLLEPPADDQVAPGELP